MTQEIERPRKLGVPRSRKMAGARCDRSNAVINAAKTILAWCGAIGASAVSFWPACMALGSDGRRAILPNGAPPMGARHGPDQNEGSLIKCGAFDVRWKCIFRADSALYIDGGVGKENFISSPVRDMMQSCTPNYMPTCARTSPADLLRDAPEGAMPCEVQCPPDPNDPYLFNIHASAALTYVPATGAGVRAAAQIGR